MFAFRPLGSSSVKLVPWPADNHQIAHEQLFFCNGGVVTENMGFGSLDRMFDGRGTVIIEDPAAFARYEVVDPTRYDYDIMSRVVLRMCQPRPYDALTDNCQHWADEQRRLYAAAMAPTRRGVIRRRDGSGTAPERRVIRRRGDRQPRR